jgi:hypothetical protein
MDRIATVTQEMLAGDAEAMRLADEVVHRDSGEWRSAHEESCRRTPLHLVCHYGRNPMGPTLRIII